jgi:hypothetical protein
MHLHPEATRHLIDHNEEHVKSSEFIKDIVIGMSDGLTVPFALAAGLSGAVDSTCFSYHSRYCRNCCWLYSYGFGWLSGWSRRN